MAFNSVLQNLADEAPAEKLQIISIHPGSLFTEAAQKSGYDENTIPWDTCAFLPFLPPS